MTNQPTGVDYYVGRKSALLKQHDKMMALGAGMMYDQYGESVTGAILAETRATFELLIPKIPYIGGKANSLTDTLEQMTSLLTLYQVMKPYGIPVEEIGSLVHRMAQAWASQYPAFARRLIGRLYMSQLWRKRTRKKALVSQNGEYPGNFVFEVVDGDGQNYEWGINYLECGVVKFFQAQGADEFTPYMCVIDYLLFPNIGIDLQRQGTIANGCTHCDFRFKRGEVEKMV
jgi:hypothetical protein